MLDKVLLRAFLMIYASDFEGDDDRHPYQSGKSRSARRRAFTLLSSVCWQWLQTLTGLPESLTGHWLKKYIEREFTHFYCNTKATYEGCSNFQTFLQRVSIACYAERCTSYSKSVRPSVCPSDTRWHCVKTTRATIMGSSLDDSSMTLVFSRLTSLQNSKGNIGSEGTE